MLVRFNRTVRTSVRAALLASTIPLVAVRPGFADGPNTSSPAPTPPTPTPVITNVNNYSTPSGGCQQEYNEGIGNLT